jgi:hypothetical protein
MIPHVKLYAFFGTASFTEKGERRLLFLSSSPSPVKKRYCQVMRAPTRTVRGQPIDRSGVRAVSYSWSRMFSTARNPVRPRTIARLTVASQTA